MAENIRENNITNNNIENNKDIAEKSNMAGNEKTADNAGNAEGQQPMTIEETLKELETIIERMEDRSSSLEDTFAWYETGMKMVKECSEKIERVEKKIRILSEEGQDGEF